MPAKDLMKILTADMACFEKASEDAEVLGVLMTDGQVEVLYDERSDPVGGYILTELGGQWVAVHHTLVCDNVVDGLVLRDVTGSYVVGVVPRGKACLLNWIELFNCSGAPLASDAAKGTCPQARLVDPALHERACHLPRPTTPSSPLDALFLDAYLQHGRLTPGMPHYIETLALAVHDAEYGPL
eukprot:TRINITY_DN27785_c0_g1_i1.p1 TRINITY_DN27785_c0_g1~~TRINITY_DN27785_c0_g1_i1.p1  ORF type:complete len:201 (+),score=42.52 TRINITY_DN27785_c0_g1_i1:53-604(+)